MLLRGCRRRPGSLLRAPSAGQRSKSRPSIFFGSAHMWWNTSDVELCRDRARMIELIERTGGQLFRHLCGMSGMNDGRAT